MTTHGRINSETLSAFLEGLPDLLESLRAQGYGLGTRQHVAAHELVGSLFARGGLPPTLLELDEWLAPLICFTPAQQEDFRDRYLQWLVERRLVDREDLPPDPPPVKVPPPPPTLPTPSARHRFVRWVSAHRRPVITAGVALVVAATLFSAYHFAAAYWNEEDLTRVVTLNPPVPDPTPVPTPFADDDEVVLVTLTPSEPLAGMAWDVDKKVEVTTPPAPTLTPPPPPGFWVRNFPAVIALTLAMPFAGLGLWYFLRRRRRQRETERWRNERPRYDKIKVRGARERVFQSAALRPIARGLRHYLSVESRHLDTRSTVHASVGRGGLFTPVYGRRRTLPEYLVLIDRVGFGDQLAQFNSDIVARLAEHDVYLDTYYFHGDPRRCREAADSPQLSLSDLAARHPDHYLLIFSDGTGLLSTTTGRPEPFVEQLLFWRGRALLTPIPRLEWEYREWALEREGLKVLPASLDGLRLLVEAVSIGARSARAPGFDETPPYPDILREQPTLWQERDEPPPHQTRRLVTHLRRYLGPGGFELLCACAVYPVMQWGVTLFLAYELLGRTEVEEVLPRLLRLPWFRNGTMPQWLRRVLVRQLPRARQRLVRERLEHLLLAFLEAPEQGLRPRSAEEQAAQTTASASLLTRLSVRLATWRRRRRLRRRLEHAPARSPLSEPVFLNYITNNQHAETLPAPVRAKLFHRGIAAFGPRLVPAVALVAVAVLTALLLLLLERPTDNIYTSGASADLCALLCPRPSARTTNPDFVYTPTDGQPGQSYNLEIRAARNGEYDFGPMSVRAADNAAAKWLTFDTLRNATRTLYTRLTLAPDASPGPTELLLYDGDKLRARLPFNVNASTTSEPPRPETPRDTSTDVSANACPRIEIVPTGESSRVPNTGIYRAVISFGPGGGSTAARAEGPLTYTWAAEGDASIISGQGMPSVVLRVDRIREDSSGWTLRVVVGGGPWARSCDTSSYLTIQPSPPRLFLSVEPQSVTVCPNNPKLNEPPNSRVSVNIGLQPVDTHVTFGASVTGGKLVELGVSRANTPTYEWDLSGVSPGTYTVRVLANAGAGRPQWPRQAQTQIVTVKGCSEAEPYIPPGVLDDAAQAANDMKEQVITMNSLIKKLAGSGQINGDEERAVWDATKNVAQTLTGLIGGIGALRANPKLVMQPTLASQVDTFYTALKALESRIADVKDGNARRSLAANLDVMQKLSSQFNPLRQTRATHTGNE